MTSFTHEHATSASIKYVGVSSGGLVARELVVVAKISLNSASRDYCLVKVDALCTAAAAYAAKVGVAEITFRAAD
jgi:hypothetical protein